ncbi:ubiquitin-protein ligase E3 A [Nematocida sp. AWRm80]|nr:ubiquitin-protein ligase E3 A [Nematocida sp. AWRm80]
MENTEHTEQALEVKEQLKKQIIYGCGENNCIGIFCKVSDVEPVANEIVRILSEYGTYFTCESLYFINERIKREVLRSISPLNKLGLHMNLSVGMLPVFKCSVSRGVQPPNRMPYDYSRSVLEYLYWNLSSGISLSSAPGSPCLRTPEKKPEKETLQMNLARIIHMKKSKSTSIMLQGLFYHELNKLRVSYDSAAAVRIVKLFNAVKESVKFEKRYFIRFLEAIQRLCEEGSVQDFLCMDNCNRQPGGLSYNQTHECGFTESEEFIRPGERKEIKPYVMNRVIEVCVLCGGSLADCDYPHCDYLCYTSGKICVNELIDLIKSLIIVIDNTSVINMREGTLLLAILKSLKGLHTFAVTTGIVHHSIFVNRRFSRLLNYKAEIKYHKEGAVSILDYPFILDMAAKSDLIQIENTDRMKAELQDAFFRSLFEGKIPPYLSFEVKRETIVEDSLALLQSIEKEMVWKQLKIKFHGEEGVDSGGIKKEFFQILSQRTLGQWDIFEEKNGYLWIKTMSPEEMHKRENEFYILGCILGLAAYNGAVLCFYFPHVFYKKLLSQPCALEDIKQIDPSLYQSLVNLRNMSSEELSSLGLEIVTVNGFKDVCKDNLEEFIKKYYQDVLDKSIAPAFENIKKGMWSICGNTFIRSLLPCELSVLIGGMECQNFDEIEKYTIYNGYRKDSILVQYFWEIFKEYDTVSQKKFLRFVTGTDRAPSGGLSRLAIVFMRNGGDTDRLPSSQTCFNTFLIPEYSSKEKLKEKLDIAISHTEGFFLL